MCYLKRLWSSLTPRPFDDIALGVCLCVLAVFIGFEVSQSSIRIDAGWRGLVLTSALVGLVSLNTLEHRGYGADVAPHTAVVLLAARIVLIEVAAAQERFGVANILYLIAPMKAFSYFPQMAAYGVSALVLGVFFVRLQLVKPDWYDSVTGAYTFILFAIGVLLTSYSAGLIARERRSRIHAEALLSDLELSHRRLARYAHKASETAALEERNRLAREIHDGLGHYLTAINIQLEKALVFYSREPEDALQALRDARRLGSEALEDVRHSVGALRDAGRGFALTQALEHLVETTRQSGLEVFFQVQGEVSGLPNAALLALYRAAQEGITNVQRHADAHIITLQLTVNDSEAVLTVKDDGRGFNLAPNGHGRYGLLGLEERLALVSGTLHITSQSDAGTCLTVRIPREAIILEVV